MTPTTPPTTLKAIRARKTQIIAITPRLNPWRSYQDPLVLLEMVVGYSNIIREKIKSKEPTQ
jgi:hypothetical protein